MNSTYQTRTLTLSENSESGKRRLTSVQNHQPDQVHLVDLCEHVMAINDSVAHIYQSSRSSEGVDGMEDLQDAG